MSRYEISESSSDEFSQQDWNIETERKDKRSSSSAGRDRKRKISGDEDKDKGSKKTSRASRSKKEPTQKVDESNRKYSYSVEFDKNAGSKDIREEKKVCLDRIYFGPKLWVQIGSGQFTDNRTQNKSYQDTVLYICREPSSSSAKAANFSFAHLNTIRSFRKALDIILGDQEA